MKGELRIVGLRTVGLVIAGLMSVGLAAPAFAQSAPKMTLVEALKIAEERSETLAQARAGETRAEADKLRANSGRLPNINFTASYDRTLASEFSGIFDSSSSSGSSSSSSSGGSDVDFSKLPFGQRNVYRATFSFSQPLYTGGRVTAQRKQADLGRENASLASSAALAQLQLEVTKAFYDSALADRLVAIAESGLEQATAAFEQTRKEFEAGRKPEFELLRAQVARDNQQPIVIRRRADRETAYLRLRQLLKMPKPEPLAIDVELDVASLPAPAPFAADLETSRMEPPKATRSQVAQAETLVQVREAAVAIAKAERLPAVNLTSSFGKVGYPSSGAFPGFDDFRTNATLGVQVSVPLFSGFRIQGDTLAASADLTASQAQRNQTKALAGLDTETAIQELASAEAAWQASAGTIQQAQRAYEIADLRYREGLSTQLELSDSRLSLQIAQANRAQAARDLQIARTRVALLKNLPIGAR
ncbi:MAG: TolC family protein [Acidobacteria bacterium]|nr:MAG: TolC family protein [Acidobacteriota bacterium]